MTEAASRPAADVVPDLLAKTADRTRGRLKDVQPDSPDQTYHAARIGAKNLRYAAEAIGPFVARRAGRVRDIAAAATDVQDLLGAHQDALVMQQQVRETMEVHRKDAVFAFAAGRYAERLDARRRDLRAGYPEVRDQLLKRDEAMGRRVSEGTIRAAGGVLWRTAADADGPAAIEVAIIHRPRYDDWSLPKGKLAAGEREVDGAIREVLEETGYHVRLGRSLGETRYLKVDSAVGRQKVVRWWAMEAASGGFGPTREVDELRWLTLGEAHDLMTRDMDRDVLDRFVRGSSTGRMVLLVRNGSATSRNAWEGDDRLRPLDPCGWAQADELVRLLAHFDPSDIRAADVVRCQQTVQPLASALGLPVTEEPLLAEDGFASDEAAAATVVRTAGDAARLRGAVQPGRGDPKSRGAPVTGGRRRPGRAADRAQGIGLGAGAPGRPAGQRRVLPPARSSGVQPARTVADPVLGLPRGPLRGTI